MRVDREKHAGVLFTRCEQILRREAEKFGMHCIPGRLEGEILVLFIGESTVETIPFLEIAEGVERAVLEQVSLRGSLMIEEDLHDFKDIEREIIRLVPGYGGRSGPSSLSIKETLLQHIETGNEAGLNQAVGMVLRWLDSRSDTKAALEKMDEVLAVLRHELSCRVPGLELPSCARLVLRETSEQEREDVLRETLRCLQDTVQRQTVVGHPAVRFAVEVLRRRFREELSVEDIADETGHSPSHLSRLFRIELGTSIMDYLTRLRMDEAKRLLLGDDDKNIGQIAEASGYRDPNYFSRVFRRETGLSPREYRVTGKCG